MLESEEAYPVRARAEQSFVGMQRMYTSGRVRTYHLVTERGILKQEEHETVRNFAETMHAGQQIHRASSRTS